MNDYKEFEKHINDNRLKLLSFLYSKVLVKDDAEDILQRACLTMWKKYDTFDKSTEFIHWAFVVADFEFKNYRRKQMRCPVIFNDEVFDDVSKFCTDILSTNKTDL